MKKMTFFGLLISLLASVAMAQGTVTINVSGMKNSNGKCKVWFFDKADGFPTDEKKAVKCVEAPINGNKSQFVFENIPAGTYAVGVIHDENGNHKFDTNFMGIPKEAYGTTNDVRGGIGGPPKFEPAKITIPKTGATLAITVK